MGSFELGKRSNFAGLDRVGRVWPALLSPQSCAFSSSVLGRCRQDRLRLVTVRHETPDFLSDIVRVDHWIAGREAAAIRCARIVLLSGDGVGTSVIMAQTGRSKTCVWRWQERFMHDGVDGLSAV